MNGHPTPTPIEAQGFFTGIRPVAVAVGALVDHVSTMVLNLVLLGFIAQGYETEPGEAISEEALEAIAKDPDVLGAWLCIGTLCTAFGGFMGARIASTHHARHGAFVGLAGVVMGLIAYSAQQTAHPPPFWYDLLSFLVLVPAGAIGGLVSSRVSPSSNPPKERDEAGVSGDGA